MLEDISIYYYNDNVTFSCHQYVSIVFVVITGNYYCFENLSFIIGIIKYKNKIISIINKQN